MVTNRFRQNRHPPEDMSARAALPGVCLAACPAACRCAPAKVFQISGKWGLSVDPREPCFASLPDEPDKRAPGLRFGMVLLWLIAGTGLAACPALRFGAAAGGDGLFSSARRACGCCSCGARAR